MLQLTPVLKQSGIHLLPHRKQSLYATFRTVYVGTGYAFSQEAGHAPQVTEALQARKTKLY